MASIRTKIYLVKFKSQPTGTITHFLKYDDEVNLTLQTLFHCPVVTFMWDIKRDIIKILLGVSIRFDIRTAIINLYVVRNMKLDKNKYAIINVIMLITKGVLYSLYYWEEKGSQKQYYNL